MWLKNQFSTLTFVVGILVISAGQADATELCNFVVKQAPAVLRSAIGTPLPHVSGRGCSVNAADKKSWLIARFNPSAPALRLSLWIRASSMRSLQPALRSTNHRLVRVFGGEEEKTL